MFQKRTFVVLAVTAILAVLVLDAVLAEPGHPMRPERFASEEQVRKYLEDLKSFYEENVRRGRYGKRNLVDTPKKYKLHPRHELREIKDEEDYYAQYTI